MGIFAFSRNSNLFLRISADEKTMADVADRLLIFTRSYGHAEPSPRHSIGNPGFTSSMAVSEQILLTTT